VWSAIHVLFRETTTSQDFGLSLTVPILPSLDVFATLLAAAAALALFRFNVGVMRTLLARSLAGVALQLTLGGLQ
jgi:chromate transporter